MSSVNYRTSRDLFLAHHWQRYLAYDRSRDEHLFCGRIAAKDGSKITVMSGNATKEAKLVSWLGVSLREPKASESAPSVHEVLSIGDWVGVDAQGAVVLFAPCGDRLTTPNGTSVLQLGDGFQARSKAWAIFLGQVRDFFEARDFLEVTTPTLAPSPGTEPFLDPLSVLVESEGRPLEKFLITSPEFHLKKALAAGLPRIFEIAKCFRNREVGNHHRVEFHMLEWYRSFASLQEIAEDVQALMEALSPKTKLIRTTMRELFEQQLAVRLTPEMTREQLANEAVRLEVRFTDDDSFDDIFHRLFLEKLEPRLGEFARGGPLLISGYPPSMAALARIGADGFADRFEVYWSGLELCNAFHELNDPFENRRRFEADNRAKVASGRNAVPLDEELLRSFDLGVPPAGGIAMGLERLFMALHGVSDISEVRPFLLDS
jgi:elongation factor P--(R)-beta-lysine ligase